MVRLVRFVGALGLGYGCMELFVRLGSVMELFVAGNGTFKSPCRSACMSLCLLYVALRRNRASTGSITDLLSAFYSQISWETAEMIAKMNTRYIDHVLLPSFMVGVEDFFHDTSSS